MSFTVSAAVWAHTRARGVSLLVLVALADRADRYARCWAGVEYLIDKTGLTRRTVQRSLRELEDNGELRLITPGGGRRRTATYEITAAARASDQPSETASEWRPFTDEKGAKSAPKGRQKLQKRAPNLHQKGATVAPDPVKTRYSSRSSQRSGTLPKPFPLRREGFDAGAASVNGTVVRSTTVAADVVAALSSLPAELGAAEFQNAAEQALVALGFVCDREVFVDDRGDGQRGRLDLVAERGTERIAVELDSHTPRAKSVTKLRGVHDAARLIVLRHPERGPLPRLDGIDVVIGAGRSQSAAPGAPAEALTPVTSEDRRVWTLALGHLPPMNQGNRQQIEMLELLGRHVDGGLVLLAPLGQDFRRFRGVVERALNDAGDEHAQLVAIVEAAR